jgi:hypothetical protein
MTAVEARPVVWARFSQQRGYVDENGDYGIDGINHRYD